MNDAERPEAGAEPAAEPGEDAAAVDEDAAPEHRAGAAGEVKVLQEGVHGVGAASKAEGVDGVVAGVWVDLELVFGGILGLLGSMLLMGSIDLGPGWDIFARLWPLALLLPGALLVLPRAGRWPSTRALLAGGLLLAVGLINLLGSLDIWWGYSAWGRLWPLLLVAIGAAIVLPRVDSRD